MALRAIIAGLAALVAGNALATTGTIVLTCTAFGGSHTARMTFDFDPKTCRLYWREIARVLPLEICTGEALVAIKPFSPTVQSRLHFNLATGRFVDQYGDVEDRGNCEAAPSG